MYRFVFFYFLESFNILTHKRFSSISSTSLFTTPVIELEEPVPKTKPNYWPSEASSEPKPGSHPEACAKYEPKALLGSVSEPAPVITSRLQPEYEASVVPRLESGLHSALERQPLK